MMTPQKFFSCSLILLLCTLLPVPSFADDWVELQKFVAADRAAQARFGSSVSTDGGYAIVGAHLEAMDASGGNMLYGAGAAYIFIRIGDTWVQQQKLVASDRHAQALFGYSVSLSGSYAVVGAIYEPYDSVGSDSAFRAGAAYLFERSGTTWTQVRKVTARDRRRDDNFGVSVGISGGRAIIGAWGQDLNAGGTGSVSSAGAAYIYVRTDSGWTLQQKITAAAREVGASFGFAVAASGDRVLVGAMDEDPSGLSEAGAAYIFRWSDTTWRQEKRIVAPDAEASNEFGWSVALSREDAAIGAHRAHYTGPGPRVNLAGAVYVYAQADTDWVFHQKLFSNYRTNAAGFGYSVSITDSHLIGGCATWRAHVFARSAGTWSEVRQLVAHDSLVTDDFGNAVAVSAGHAMVGAPRNWLDPAGGNNLAEAGAVYVFGTNVTAVGSDGSGDIPSACRLSQNYPNPFNPATTIGFELSGSVHVRLSLIDLLGREVAVLIDDRRDAGPHKVTLDASALAGGVYLYRLEAGGRVQARKMLLIR